ncbi:lytic transglycosylase [Shewanella glacialimarina]|uniref:lytic transglycosylase n=1 Tax=Shewanella glacialimarina TaxID=2590884 RepID=UPI001CF9194D|nr:LysM peptidoglycan-binding domain-containing protein [Shewanella glacialimarina]UCX04730.1 LysM peptidoglycan-binding domain-containing protein [Shewanella glacialimarina]
MKTKLTLLAASIILVIGCQSVKHDIDTDPVIDPTLVKVPTKLSKQPTSIEDIEDDLAQANDVWQRIRDGMQLRIADKELVEHYRQKFIENPHHLEVVTQRAEPFLFFILEEIEKRNLPTELALLPIIESAFDPSATSSSDASGLWQLTLPTAAAFKVKTNWWYDGRRDIRASTIAALDLLEYLYAKMDKNWIYALAAYNSGEGRVLNAIKRNKNKGTETNFWMLKLPKETAHYVPQLLALADIVKNSSELGIHLAAIENKPRIEMVNIESQLDLNLAAEMANISVEELKLLNPGLTRWATAPEGPHYLTIPADNAKGFKRSLASLDPNSRINWVRYKIKPGDSISEIADQFETSPTMIRSSNGIKDNNITAGRFLIIPIATKDADIESLHADQQLARKPVVKSSTKGQSYLVKSGDNLWNIAKNNNISVDQITKWNRLRKDQSLKIGQNLIFYPNEIAQTNGLSEKVVNYRVKSGDSLARIAAAYKVTVADLIEWNSLQKNKYLQPGQMLKLLIANS